MCVAKSHVRFNPIARHGRARAWFRAGGHVRRRTGETVDLIPTVPHHFHLGIELVLIRHVGTVAAIAALLGPISLAQAQSDNDCAVQLGMSALGQKRTSPYSITSSARASTAGGTARPSALAVLRLMTSSYLFGACTGRLAGFSPLRMRST